MASRPAAEHARAAGAAARLRQAWPLVALPLSLLAISLGLVGQRLLLGRAPDEEVIAWYGVAVAVLLLGWWDTYTNRSLVRLPRAAQTTIPVRLAAPASRPRRGAGARLGLAGGVAGATTLLALGLLQADWNSAPGLLLWAAGLVLFGLAAVSAGPATHATPGGPLKPAVPGTRSHARLLEAAILLAILAGALALRLWRLDDLAPGMHGDEGEAGAEALRILGGQGGSPFVPGWMNQPNLYYWALALTMKVFGTGLGGLRAFSVGCGLLTVLFVYLLAREMFGPRAAAIAGILAACGSADLFFSRAAFSHATLPPALAITAYGLVRGLRTRHPADFAVAGAAAGLAVYGVAGGVLAGAVAGVFLLGLALRHPGFLGVYRRPVAAAVIAFTLVSAPFWTYAAGHPIPDNRYPADRLIWTHYDQLARQWGVDGWPAILWGQVEGTLAVLTHRADSSALGALDYPVARPLEAVFLVLGVAWAAWRWRDTRFALISLLFWAPIAAGVITIDAPNLPAIVGILPALALAGAALLDHLATQVAAVVGALFRGPAGERAGAALGGAVAAGALAIVGVQNGQMFLGHYLNTHQSPDTTAQAAIVRRIGPAARFYDLGTPQIFWHHGDNRFLNPGASGADLANPADGLPIRDNGPAADRDAVFLVWNAMADYLPVLRAYYPEGITETVPLGDSDSPLPPLIVYTVPRAAISSHRVLQARYVPAQGDAVVRAEAQLGLAGAQPPPPGLIYPVAASWDGAVVAPAYRRYTFQLRAAGPTRLAIDGLDVFSATVAPTAPITAALVLARGPHTVHLTTTLPAPGRRVDIQWAGTGSPLKHIAARYLWDDHIGRGWSGEIGPVDPFDPLGEIGGPVAGRARTASPTSERVDGLLGFRDTGPLFGPAPVGGHWSSVLQVAQSGHYSFTLASNGDSALSIDGRPVLANPSTGQGIQETEGGRDLAAGPHTVEIRYAWLGGPGLLECRWTPPGGGPQLFLTPALQPATAGAWPPDSIAPPPEAPPAPPAPVPTTPLPPQGAAPALTIPGDMVYLTDLVRDTMRPR